MTPYIKKIVELHKIHKAIEDKDCNGGGNTPSGDITIDDVVKFIHDDLAAQGYEELFPYTTWNEIPDFADVNTNEVCKSDNIENFINANSVIFNIINYIIGFKPDNGYSPNF